MKTILFLMALATTILISSSVLAQNKVVVVPLGVSSAASASPRIVHITFNAPNSANSCLDCYGVKMQGAGKVLAVQTWATQNVGNDWWGDVEKNGTTVLATRPKFIIQTVDTGIVKTDGTEIFAEGDVLTFSTVEDSENPHPIYSSVTAIIQYN